MPRGLLRDGSPCTHLLGAPPQTPGDFLAKRKSPKIRQEPPGSWTSGTRGRTPLDSPGSCPSGIGCGGMEIAASSGGILAAQGGALFWWDDNNPSRVQGQRPWHAFGSFRRETKGTPGVGRVGPLMGRSEEPSLTTCSRRGAAPPRIGGCRDYVLAEIPGPCTHKPRPSPIYMAKKPFLRREPV